MQHIISTDQVKISEDWSENFDNLFLQDRTNMRDKNRSCVPSRLIKELRETDSFKIDNMVVVVVVFHVRP